tara:strand:+ start:337 stop:516 length:180 start_codon:yes stop_codon:yes gene_type:complete
MSVNEPTLSPEFKAFKHGVYDAVIHGRMDDSDSFIPYTHYYKRGYDFGMVIYSDKESEE